MACDCQPLNSICMHCQVDERTRTTGLTVHMQQVIYAQTHALNYVWLTICENGASVLCENCMQFKIECTVADKTIDITSDCRLFLL